MLLKTTNGYHFSEVASAFQKSIRRGIEAEALYWGTAGVFTDSEKG